LTFFALDDEQQALVDLARTIASENFSAKEGHWSTRAELPWAELKIARDAGLVALSVPEEYGGGGRSPIDSILLVEALTSVAPATAAFINLFDLGPAGILTFLGSPDQKDKYLRRLVAGELLPAIGLTEPEAGTALTSLKTRAVVDGDRCTINGRKIFTSFSPVADIFFVYVRFGEGNRDIGAVIVERDDPGFEVGAIQRYMSGEPWAPLYFDNCTVPTDRILPLKEGFKDLISIYSIERTAAAAKCVGIAQFAFERALRHANQREQFGRKIGDFQGIQWKIADMATRIESARMLTYRAADNAVNGRPVRYESSMAKLAASEAACYVCDETIQIFGGTGISVDGEIEWLYRLARGYRVAGGTSEIHRTMIGKDFLAAAR
jgi:alkylation response protein AidB-like acyl-CoA dehydrogenase